MVSILRPASSFQKRGAPASPRAAQLGTGRARFGLGLVSSQAQAPSSAVGTFLSVAVCQQSLQATSRLGGDIADRVIGCSWLCGVAD